MVAPGNVTPNQDCRGFSRRAEITLFRMAKRP
jgi:hypothetical protein